ncbi:MAG: type VI secretion system contractile sheath small subunit [Gemmatimonadaceae bacterium]|nr:type VI secretion system contractile sheath small subunit [Gemmatimonadaceae bacterium]
MRPPRVNIVYEVETGGAIEERELPFVMGVMGDFTGQPAEALPRLRDRKFTDVTLDNFDATMAAMKPRLVLKVENTLSEKGGTLPVELTFQGLDDFAPDRIAHQVEPLRKLLEIRQQLADLRGSLQGNDKLDEILQATINDADKLARLRREVGAEETADA